MLKHHLQSQGDGSASENKQPRGNEETETKNEQSSVLASGKEDREVTETRGEPLPESGSESDSSGEDLTEEDKKKKEQVLNNLIQVVGRFSDELATLKTTTPNDKQTVKQIAKKQILVNNLISMVEKDWNLAKTLSESTWKACCVPAESVTAILAVLQGPQKSVKQPALQTWNGLCESFQCEYVGDVKNLSDEINKCYMRYYTNGSILAPYFSIIQSSGTGKSRDAAEVSKMRYALYICLRNPLKSSGYPWASPKELTYFLKIDECNWFNFFCASVAVLKTLLLRPEADLDQPLDTLFEEILRQAKASIEKTPSDGGEWKTSPEKLFTKLVLERVDGSSDDFASHFWSAVIECARSLPLLGEPYRFKNREYCKWQCTDKNLPLVFVFDEARALVGETPPLPQSPFCQMRRGLRSEGKQLGIFAVLLDSCPSVIYNDFPSSLTYHHDPSSRVALPRALLPPLIHIVPTDRFVTQDKIPQKLQDVCCFDYLVLLGRPLWSKNHAGNAVSWHESVHLAAKKLGLADLYSNSRFAKWDQRNQSLAVAMLGARVHISTRPASQLTGELLKSSLWTLIGLSKDRESLYGYYLSEPVVAIACYMKMSMTDFLAFVLSTVTGLLKQGCCDVSGMGEFVARLVLVMAWDDIHDPHNRGFETLFEMHSVDEYLNRLVNEDQLKGLNGKPTWLSRILNGKMVFTHFARCLESLIEDPLQLVDLLRRGAGGYFANPNQGGIDLVIPFVFEEKETLELENVSCILVQVKNWETPGSEEWENNLLEACRCALPESFEKRPIVSIVYLVNHPNPGISVVAAKSELDLQIVIRDTGSIPFLQKDMYSKILPSLKRLANNGEDDTVFALEKENAISWCRKNQLEQQ